MLCEECNRNPATVRYTSIQNGKKVEKSLCAECMHANKLALPFAFSLNDLLAGLFDSGKTQEIQEASDLKCEACGLTYEQFRQSGLLGCAHCYEAFRKPLVPILHRIHGRVQHAGRVPRSAEELMQRKRDIQQLKDQLKEAISQENYEKAAELRDAIRTLEKPAAGKVGEADE